MRVGRPSSPPTLTVLVLLAAACADGAVAPSSEDGGSPLAARIESARAAATDRHLVLLRPGARPDGVRAAAASMGGVVQSELASAGVLGVRGLSDGAASALAARDDVVGIARDYRVQMVPPRAALMRGTRPASGARAETDQSDATFFPIQWNLRVIQADVAWRETPQGAGALACILDTGVDPTHQDLVGKVDLSRSRSFVESEPFIEDLHFHGTHVSGTVSSNGIGTASVAPDATLCAVKVLGADGNGSWFDVARGIVFAAEVGADAINMSLGGYLDREHPGDRVIIQTLQRAVDAARRHGSQVVASAGNDAIDLDDIPPRFVHVPADLSGVTAVAATAPIGQRDFDLLASYSNFGRRSVDIAAPGGDLVEDGLVEDLIIAPCSSFVPGCEGGDWYVFAAGTSMAAPHVTGAGAVVESNLPGDQPGWHLDACILHNADHPPTLVGKVREARRLNVLKAALCAGLPEERP